INIVAQLPVRLTDAALLNALTTATEAKSQALQAAGIPGTGTASDAVTVSCPVSGPAEPFGGPRSTWGARLARAVHDAVRAGVCPRTSAITATWTRCPGWSISRSTSDRARHRLGFGSG